MVRPGAPRRPCLCGLDRFIGSVDRRIRRNRGAVGRRDTANPRALDAEELTERTLRHLCGQPDDQHPSDARAAWNRRLAASSQRARKAGENRGSLAPALRRLPCRERRIRLHAAGAAGPRSLSARRALVLQQLGRARAHSHLGEAGRYASSPDAGRADRAPIADAGFPCCGRARRARIRIRVSLVVDANVSAGSRSIRRCFTSGPAGGRTADSCPRSGCTSPRATWRRS